MKRQKALLSATQRCCRSFTKSGSGTASSALRRNSQVRRSACKSRSPVSVSRRRRSITSLAPQPRSGDSTHSSAPASASASASAPSRVVNTTRCVREETRSAWSRRTSTSTSSSGPPESNVTSSPSSTGEAITSAPVTHNTWQDYPAPDARKPRSTAAATAGGTATSVPSTASHSSALRDLDVTWNETWRHPAGLQRSGAPGSTAFPIRHQGSSPSRGTGDPTGRRRHHTRPHEAGGQQRTTLAVLRHRLRGTRATHPIVAEREVVADGVLRVQGPQRRRHLLRRAPRQILPARKTQMAGDAADVRVQRNHQDRGRYPLPDT